MGFVKQWYRLDEVAEYFSVGVSTVRGWAANKKLEAIKMPNGHYRIARETFEALTRGGASPNR